MKEGNTVLYVTLLSLFLSLSFVPFVYEIFDPGVFFTGDDVNESDIIESNVVGSDGVSWLMLSTIILLGLGVALFLFYHKCKRDKELKRKKKDTTRSV